MIKNLVILLLTIAFLFSISANFYLMNLVMQKNGTPPIPNPITGALTSTPTQVPAQENTGKRMDILTYLNSKLGLPFSTVRDEAFTWTTETGEKKEVQGRIMEATEVTAEQSQEMNDLMLEQGFEVDTYNSSTATMTTVMAYRRASEVCALKKTIANADEIEGMQDKPTPSPRSDIIIFCGAY